MKVFISLAHLSLKIDELSFIKFKKMKNNYFNFHYYMIKRAVRTGNCYCNQTFDVRCCCWVNDETFDKCKQKIPTTYFRITNEYELYKKINEFGINSIKSYIQKTCRLNDIEWKEIVNIYIQDQELS